MADDVEAAPLFVNTDGDAERLPAGRWVLAPVISERWMLSPHGGLKFIRDEYGRAILHQAWSSDRGNLEWRPVPMEETEEVSNG